MQRPVPPRAGGGWQFPRILWLLLLLPIPLLLVVQTTGALDRMTFRRDGRAQSVRGKVVATGQDGGVLLRTASGILWTIQPNEIVGRTHDSRPFVPLTAAQMEAVLRAELPAGFKTYKTAHYVICYNTSRAYARWCGGLLERLYGAFMNFWRRRGFPLHDPSGPLVALLFADAGSYGNYAHTELGAAAGSIVGYYSLRNNRMTSYDLTGIQALHGRRGRRGSMAEINQTLSRPAAEPLVATVVHEATHQICFNCGLLTRYADIPLWVSEGIAVYFETPDLKSSRGWRGIGHINRTRLDLFRQHLPSHDTATLESLIADDTRFRDTHTAAAAYAEAWALNDFLIHRRWRQYVKYLTMLSKKREFMWDDRTTRLAEFKRFFGEDLETFEVQFRRHVEKLIVKGR